VSILYYVYVLKKPDGVPFYVGKGQEEKMPKYRVYGIWTASKLLGVFEAANPVEAEDMAAESKSNYASLCHQCSGEVELNDYSAERFEVEIEEEEVLNGDPDSI
jgi:hypothetical protein